MAGMVTLSGPLINEGLFSLGFGRKAAEAARDNGTKAAPEPKPPGESTPGAERKTVAAAR